MNSLLVKLFLNEPELTVKWLQVLLLNINNSIQHYSLICTLSNIFKYFNKKIVVFDLQIGP